MFSVLLSLVLLVLVMSVCLNNNIMLLLVMAIQLIVVLLLVMTTYIRCCYYLSCNVLTWGCLCYHWELFKIPLIFSWALYLVVHLMSRSQASNSLDCELVYQFPRAYHSCSPLASGLQCSSVCLISPDSEQILPLFWVGIMLKQLWTSIPHCLSMWYFCWQFCRQMM